jgi:hypothetical protein
MRREINVFNLSFLDVISCGLGAVVTLLLIAFPMAAAVQQRQARKTQLYAQIRTWAKEAHAARERAAAVQSQVAVLRKEESQNQDAIRALGRYVDQLLAFNFAGVYTEKKNILILMDLSGSMASQREELLAVTRALVDIMEPSVAGGTGYRFNIIGFGAAGPELFPSAFPGQGLVPATEPSRTEAKTWIDTAVRGLIGGGTPTLEAFKRAFAVPDVDAILLLTDGAPNEPMASVLSEVDALNVHKRVEVHAIGIGDKLFTDESFRNFLRDLASRNNGRFAAYWTKKF